MRAEFAAVAADPADAAARDRLEDEIGDLLFVCRQHRPPRARSMSAPRCAAPTSSSSAASARWRRWREPMASRLPALSLEAQDRYWNRAKADEKLDPPPDGCRACSTSDAGASAMSRFASFREFYPFYLGEHRNRTSRRLHFIGSCGVLALLAVAIVARQCLVAAGGAALRLRLRLGRAFLLREEPAGDVQAPVLFVRRRLGDVQGHPDRADQVPFEESRLTSVQEDQPRRRRDQREAGPVVPLQRLVRGTRPRSRRTPAA